MFAECEGQKIYYETAGAGECLTFLHGWGGSTDSFRGAAKEFCKTHRVINLDFAGFGQSPKPESAICVEDYVRHVVAVLAAEGIEKTHIVAHSFGGRVAAMLCAEHPHLAGKLVLVDSAGIKPRFNLIKAIKIWRYKMAKRKNKSLSGYGSSDYRALSPGMRATFVRVVNQDLAETFKKITVPTLLIWGKKDKDTPLYMARKINKLVANSALIVFENAGHYSYVENYSAFIAILDSFLDG